jgi:hypothetical protein
MDPWSNIGVSSQDTEIAEIDKFEGTLDNIPAPVRKIRELITRFEVCHFKYEQHLKYINNSIARLEPSTNPGKIGSNHINKGENAWENDKTGRSLIGQQYLWIFKNWLAKNTQEKIPNHYNKNLYLQTSKWLGEKTPDKERIIRLLIARLTYDWESYEKLQQGGQFEDLEYQTCRMDICHYAFPNHLDYLLQAIGEMKPRKELDGCGSYNTAIKTFIREKFSELCCSIEDMTGNNNFLIQNNNEQIKAWLYACLAKTLKEQIGILDSIPKLPHKI